VFAVTSLVTTFISFKQAGTFEQNVGSAIKYCTEARLSRQLTEELKNADIFRQYELLIHLQPWKRHPATLTLKKIYAHLMVLFFRLLAVHWTEPSCFQDSGYPSINESDVEARLKALWSAFIWEVVPDADAALTGLSIWYVKLI